MANNNLNHISDLSKYKIFDPTNTSWPSTVTDVQTALGLIGSWSRTDTGLPTADATTAGIVRMATQAEIDTGTSGVTAVSPAMLEYKVSKPNATTTVVGMTRYATNAEAAASTVTDAAITAASLGYAFANKTGSTTNAGTLMLAGDAQAKAGTDTTTATSPAIVKQMITLFTPAQVSYQPATNTTLGVVYVATAAQVAAGTLDTGYSISPKALMSTTSSNTQVGVIRTATLSETITGSSTTLAVTPSGLAQLTSTVNRAGIAKMASTFTADTTLVAQASRTVFIDRQINGHYMNTDVNLTPGDIGTYSSSDIDNKIATAENQLNTNINNVQSGLINNPINLGNLYSIAFLANRTGVTLNPGDTVDGSQLAYAGIGADWSTTSHNKDYAVVAVSWGPTGTWKCLGYCPVHWSDGGFVSLFIRIA